MSELKVFRARFPSKCARCSQPIVRGEQIAMLPGSGAVHERCVPETFKVQKSSTEAKAKR